MIILKIISSSSRVRRTDFLSIILRVIAVIAVKLLCGRKSDSSDFCEPLC